MYQQQYERMKRWYARFQVIDQGRLHDMPSDYYLDEIYAFFLNCYHLKDWIKNDNSITPKVRNMVEDCIKANRSLLICADICNSLKHFRLDNSRSGENPTFGHKHYAVGLGSGLPTTISLKYEVDTSSGLIDAFVLATECVNTWDTFLKINKMI